MRSSIRAAGGGGKLPLLIGIATIAAIALSFAPTPVLAQPQLPATFYGSASIDGKPVPDGTPVHGFIDGVDCTQAGPTQHGTVTDGNVSAYVIEVVHASQVPGCGGPGKKVTFTIGGKTAGQQADWVAGPQHLDSNAGSGSPEPLPTATLPPTLPPAQVASTATAAAKFTPGPATTLPTDDVQLPGSTHAGTAPPGTPTPHLPGSVQGSPSNTPSSSGPPVVLIIVAVLFGIAIVGGAAGFALSRRENGGRGKPPAE